MTTNLPLLCKKDTNNFFGSIKNYPILKNILHTPEEKSAIDEKVYRKDGKRLEKIISRDAETDAIIKITNFDYFDDKKIKSVEDFLNGVKFRETTYSLFKSVTEYDIKTGKKYRTTNFNMKNPDKKASVYDYDIETGKIVKMSVYRADGENLAFVKELSPETGLVTRCINYKINSPAISSVAKFDFLGGTTVKTTYYYSTPIHSANIDSLNKKLASDSINLRVLSNPKKEHVSRLIDNLYKNKMSFSSINKS